MEFGVLALWQATRTAQLLADTAGPCLVSISEKVLLIQNLMTVLAAVDEVLKLLRLPRNNGILLQTTWKGEKGQIFNYK